MTQSDADSPGSNESHLTPQERLRTALLISALSDWVPLAEVETAMSYYNVAETGSARQDFTLRIIRSLLEDGLMQIGDLAGPGEKFPVWDLSIDAAMNRVHDLYVGQYDHPELWEFTIWLGLTATGERLANQLRRQTTN